MYFKDNQKSGKCSVFAEGFVFPYYEFSKIQQWLEVGQGLLRIFILYGELDVLLNDIDSKHGPILQREYDKTTGLTSGTAKPIKEFVPTEQIKFFCRLIEEMFNRDLDLISRVEPKIRELRPFKNLMENLKIYGIGSRVSRDNVEKYFDYITLDSLRHNLLEFWDLVRKLLDDKTNEIIIPKPTTQNREFYSYFLQSRDNYVQGDEEAALAIIRKAVEDILSRLWILSHDRLHEIDLKKRENLDNLPGVLKNKRIITEQEFRDIQPYIKYGNAGSHIWGEISKDKLTENARRMINNGINFINNLSKKYIDMMISKGYCKIEFTKTGFTVSEGDLNDYLTRKVSKNIFENEDIEEFKEE